MSLARAKNEQRDVDRQDFSILAEVAREFTRRFPRCGKHLQVYALRQAWQLYWSEIAENVNLNRSHCSRVFYETQRRIEALKKEKFAGVARLRLLRDDDDDLDGDE